jgi:Leucine-rich repeat (LRR) protein
MKKKILLISILLLNIATCFTGNAAGVILNSTNFPDSIFRAFISKKVKVAEGNTITTRKLDYVTDIECSSMNIASLTGIEYFTKLTSLVCTDNNLTSLDLSHNTALKILRCEQNQIDTLDLSHNKVLTDVYCSENQLATLIVPDSTKLKWLDCHTNNLTAIDASPSTGLITLYCNDNQLTTLNVAQNTLLQNLDCKNNQLTSIDVTNNVALTVLYCSHNPFTTLNVAQNTSLQNLDCSADNLTTLDVSQNSNLIYLDCDSNNIATIDLSNNTLLETLWCYFNKITTLDLSLNTALTFLSCSSNKLTSLNLSHNTELTDLDYSNNHLATIDLSNNTNLTNLLGYNNSRTIKVYSYKKSVAKGGGTGYYVPLTAQSATTIDGVAYGATKALATLIDDAGQSGDLTFDTTKVVSGTWGCATLGTFNGTQALLLSSVNDSITYQYNTGFTGAADIWSPYAMDDVDTVTAPNAYFTLYLDPNVISGVDGVENNCADVYTTPGAINIGGSFDGNVNVYNLRGQQVYCGRDSEISVPAGMYLVKVEGVAHKVLVK